MTNATATENQTALKGTSCLFTRCQTRENGIAPSLEKAYAILHALGGKLNMDWNTAYACVMCIAYMGT